MAEYLIQDTTLDAIADAINAKTGGSPAMTPAEMVTAIGSISGGGGGVHTEEGYVELTDVNVGNSTLLTIPVDLTSAQGFILNLYAVETGEVSDGVVTKYGRSEVPVNTGASKMWVYNYKLVYPLSPNPDIYRDETNLASIRQTSNLNYVYGRRGWNGAEIATFYTPTIASSGIAVSTLNGTRYFCMTGVYVKFKYEIVWW